MQNDQKHTPLPWATRGTSIIGPLGESIGYLTFSDGGSACGLPSKSPSRSQTDSNLALIVRAVNSHDDLLAACRAFEAARTSDALHAALSLAIAAIAKAEGK
jgi:hypothetical protein